MNTKLSSTALLLTSVVLHGCSDGSPNAPKGFDGGAATTASDDPVASGYDKYNGEYLFPCSLEQGEDIDIDIDNTDDVGALSRNDEVDIYVFQTASIQNPNIQVFTTFHTDAGCTLPFENGDQEVVNYTVSYPGGTTQTDQGLADHADITLESTFINGVEVADGVDEFANVGDTTYDIFLLDGGNLYVGLAEYDTEGDADVETQSTGDSPETRLTELDLSIVGIRQ